MTVADDELTLRKNRQLTNPCGTQRVAVFSQACRELLAKAVPGDGHGNTYAQAIAAKLGEKALSGDVRAAQELVDRAEGRPHQAIQHVGEVNLIIDMPGPDREKLGHTL